jgi:hypothetical protein
VPDPTIGVILRRDAHPGAVALDELLDPATAGKFVCDESLPLSEALARDWEEDAHLVTYALVDEDGEEGFARVSKSSPLPAQLAARRGRVECRLVCLDWDTPGHVDWASPEDPLTWVARAWEAAAEHDVPLPTVWYTTLHGCRLVYVLEAPVSGPEASDIARGLAARWAPAGFGMDARCLNDWTRLFRLPGACRADTGESFRSSPAYYILEDGPTLDPLRAPRIQSGDPRAPTVAAVPYDAPIPTPEECEALLKAPTGKGGRLVMSEFSRVARRMLRGRESFPVCFESHAMDEARLAEGWNPAVLYYAGQVVAMLAVEEVATPEGCFALLRPALEQLTARDEDGGQDWCHVGWSMVCRMWAQEEAKLATEAADRERRAEDGAQVTEKIVADLRKDLGGEVPEDPEEARKWLTRRMIATDGKRHYVMRSDGGYNVAAVSDAALIPMIRELGMEETIPTRQLRGHALVWRSPKDILAECAVPIVSVRCSVREPCSRIVGEQGELELRVPIHRLNPAVQPRFDERVDEWLRCLFGGMADEGLEWLSHCLDVKAPICSLALWGSESAGKGMLVNGIAECFKSERFNDGRAMDRFNIGLLYSPIIWCDEGLPVVRGMGGTTDEVFRNLVAGGAVQVEGKMRDAISADIYPRLVLTANQEDVLSSLLGRRELSPESVRAIERRILSIRVPRDARVLLEAKGNRRYTAGWVAGEGPSDYVVAGHIMFLHHTRRPARGSSDRFLVEGQTGTEIVRLVQRESPAWQACLRAVNKIVQVPGADGAHFADGRVWVTVAVVTNFIEALQLGHSRDVNLRTVGRALRDMRVRRDEGDDVPVTQPLNAPRKARWIELDLDMLHEVFMEYGLPVEPVKKLLDERWRREMEEATR